MDHYVEVLGEGKYLETAARFVAEVSLEVRASKEETALREVTEFCAQALVVLREAGLTDDEIIEGGMNFSRPWYWRKQIGQEATRKMILKVSDFSRLNKALEQLEPLQSRHMERKTISVSLGQPEFDDSSEIKAAALTQAFEDAKAKANRLVTVMGYRLGRPLQLEEGDWNVRGSGFAGDADWGDFSRFGWGGLVVAAGGGAGAGGESQVEQEPQMASPSRTIFVKCRARFAIDD